MKLILISILIFVINIVAVSQTYFNYEQFTDSKENKIIELYIGLEQNYHSYADSTSRFIRLELKSEKGKIICNQFYKLEKDGKNGTIIIDQINFVPDEDYYKLKIMAYNGEKKYISSIDSLNIIVKPVLNITSTLSLAYSIKKSENKESVFYKNGIEVVPNPILLYNKEKSKLFYYSEVYKQKLNINSDSISFIVRVIDNNNEIKFELKHRKKFQETTIEMGGIDINSLVAGKYKIKVYFENYNKLIQINEKDFYFTSDNDKHQVFNNSPELKFNLGSMNESEIDELFNKLSILANDNENKLYSKLKTKNDKNKFIEKFIEVKSSDNGIINSDLFYNSFMEKVNYTSQKFQTRFREGWQTDRGRIYIKYGKPSDVEMNQSGNSSKPYEIWTYNDIEGGVIFVFGDNTESGNYELLHSTKRGEITNTNWQNLLQYNTR